MKIDDYKKPVWPNFFRVLGAICLLGFSIMAFAVSTRDEELYIFLCLAVGSLIHFLFAAWCIETFSDIRHYTRETAIASGRLLLHARASNNRAQAEAEDTKPNESQEQ